MEAEAGGRTAGSRASSPARAPLRGLRASQLRTQPAPGGSTTNPERRVQQQPNLQRVTNTHPSRCLWTCRAWRPRPAPRDAPTSCPGPEAGSQKRPNANWGGVGGIPASSLWRAVSALGGLSLKQAGLWAVLTTPPQAGWHWLHPWGALWRGPTYSPHLPQPLGSELGLARGLRLQLPRLPSSRRAGQAGVEGRGR